MAEISVVADFPSQPAVSVADEIKMIQQGTWAPSTADFSGVVTRTGATAVQVGSLADFLGVIARSPKSSIQRLNVFTHADRGLISFGGYINSSATTSPDVELYVNAANQFLTALDSTSMPFVRNGGTFGPNNNPNQWNLSSLKDRFMPSALVIFFACHAGSDPKVLQDFANTLGVNGIGFTPAVAYCPTFTTNPAGINRQMDTAFGSCSSTHMWDFHQFSMAASASQIIFRVPARTP
jgi:hypothetical protein